MSEAGRAAAGWCGRDPCSRWEIVCVRNVAHALWVEHSRWPPRRATPDTAPVSSAETDPAAQDAPPSVIIASSGGISVLTLVGEIDDHTAGPLRQAPEGIEPHRPCVVADLRQVTFIDSTGINIFLAAHLAAARTGGRLRLAHLTGNVSRVFSLIGADGIIDCRAPSPTDLRAPRDANVLPRPGEDIRGRSLNSRWACLWIRARRARSQSAPMPRRSRPEGAAPPAAADRGAGNPLRSRRPAPPCGEAR